MQGKKSMFWSLFFIALGIMLFLQHSFNVNLPILRVCFGLFLIYLGARVIFGSFGIEINGRGVKSISTSTEFVFSSGDFKLNDGNIVNKNFSTVFGNSQLDLTDMSKLTNDDVIKIDNVFGKTKIKTASDVELSVKSNVAFGSIKVRGQKLGSFGDIDYKTPNFNSGLKKLNLQIDSVFGEVEVE